MTTPAKKVLTQQEEQIEKVFTRIREFAKAAHRRDGLGCKVEEIQKGASGMPNALKGTVETMNEKGEKINVPMIWNIEGRAMTTNNTGLDLVLSEKI